MSDTIPAVVSRQVLAQKWMKADVSRINQLVRDGVFSPKARGLYSIEECIPAYIQWLRNRTGEETEDERVSESAANVRLKTAQAVKVELSNALQQKEHLIRELVLQYLEELMVMFTNNITAYEGRLVGEIAGITDVSQGLIAQAINKEVNVTRTAIANELIALGDKLSACENNSPTAT